MSDNSHIDKILKDGLGGMNFSNSDAMWQRMEAELDSDGKRKKRPVIFFFALAGLLIAGLFIINHFSKTAVAVAEEKTVESVSTADNTKPLGENTKAKKEDVVAFKNNATNSINNNSIKTSTIADKSKQRLRIRNIIPEVVTADNFTAATGLNFVTESELNNSLITGQQFASDNIPFERITVDADLITTPAFKKRAKVSVTALPEKVTNAKLDKPKKEVAKQQTITFEAVGGRDFLRMNRKAGFYAGIRVNKLLEKGTVISTGVNYAEHNVLDRYRSFSKDADQPKRDAWLNKISSIRLPVYLQRQMGNSKLAMMVGLVPTYITHAEVYNVPDSYTGNPGEYRQFMLSDINRFNVLFGAGLKYSPTKWMALELSGSYGLTGMVKDGYKNQSRVNDNFKSIQLGVAFRLK